MAWDNTTSGNPATHSAVAAATVKTSKEQFISVLRDEYIPVGYNLTEEVTDATTGITSKVTTFHQTSTVHIPCKVKTAVTTEEERGLTQNAAENHAWFAAVQDNRTYARWTVGFCWVEVPNCIGTVIRVAARRVNEAGGWAVTKTTTVTTKVEAT